MTGTGQPGLRRDLTRWDSYATIIGILVGSGIFVVTGEAGGVTGPSVPLAYLALGPVILSTTVAYAVYMSTPLGMRPGGAYVHISRTTQTYLPGFLALWLKWLAYIGALVVLSTSLGRYVKFFYPTLDTSFAAVLPFGGSLAEAYASSPSLGEAVIATVALLFFFGINLIGVRFYGWLQRGMFFVLAAAIVILVVPGLFAVDLANFSPLFPYGIWPSTTPEGERGFLAALPPLFFSYAGFESLAQTAGETRDARRSLPRVFLNGVLASMLIFFGMSFTAFGVVPYQELARSSYAMSEVAGRFLPAWGGVVVTLGALMAFTTSINATLYAPVRILYVLGEDRLLPRVLSRVSPRFHTPWVSLVFNTGLALVLLWTRSFGYVLDVAILSMFVLYGVHSATVALLPYVRPALYRTALFRPRTWIVTACGSFSAASMGYLAVLTLTRDWARWQAAPAGARGLALWQLLLLWSVVGIGLFWLARREGRRAGFDYEGLLRSEWEEEARSAASGSAGTPSPAAGS